MLISMADKPYFSIHTDKSELMKTNFFKKNVKFFVRKKNTLS